MVLDKIYEKNTVALYRVKGDCAIDRILATSEKTRLICNDPFLCGVDYTSALRLEMINMLSGLQEIDPDIGEQDSAMVLHILRGGLNFGFREGLAKAYDWNRVNSAFISSQRAKDDKGGWYITENRYEKVYIPNNANIYVGDVVATGVSLEHALLKMIDLAKDQKKQIESITFFTIGSKRAEEIVEKFDQECRQAFDNYKKSRVVYLEGIFNVVNKETTLRIAISGTDLLRAKSVLTPEFIKSQQDQLSYPLERCTIYDAGSRAFNVTEYLHDLYGYWVEVEQMAQHGTTYVEYLKERFPEDERLTDEKWVAEHESTEILEKIAHEQLQKTKI